MLLKTWKETVHYIKTKDTAGLRKICADTIEYINIDYNTGKSSYRFIPLSSFFRQTLDSIVPDNRLAKALERNKPRFGTGEFYFKDASEHLGYMITFSYGNHRQKAEIFKYNEITFTYIDFKLFYIHRQRPLN